MKNYESGLSNGFVLSCQKMLRFFDKKYVYEVYKQMINVNYVTFKEMFLQIRY